MCKYRLLFIHQTELAIQWPHKHFFWWSLIKPCWTGLKISTPLAVSTVVIWVGKFLYYLQLLFLPALISFKTWWIHKQLRSKLGLTPPHTAIGVLAIGNRFAKNVTLPLKANSQVSVRILMQHDSRAPGSTLRCPPQAEEKASRSPICEYKGLQSSSFGVGLQQGGRVGVRELCGDGKCSATSLQ